jgi:hypothetical protein
MFAERNTPDTLFVNFVKVRPLMVVTLRFVLNVELNLSLDSQLFLQPH